MKTLVKLLIILAATTASAGERVVGNGGDGVMIDGRLYLLISSRAETTKIRTSAPTVPRRKTKKFSQKL